MGTIDLCKSETHTQITCMMYAYNSEQSYAITKTYNYFLFPKYYKNIVQKERLALSRLKFGIETSNI